MAILSTVDLGKYYGAHEVFSALTLAAHHDERIALVGPNGCGKSTLLDVLAGLQEPDSGNVYRARETRLGYLPQIPDFESAGSLWQAMEAVFADLHALAGQLRALEQEMAADDEAARAAAMERYGHLLEQFELAGGFTYETRIKQVLSGLGFSDEEVHAPVGHLSGGEKTRALLARLLLEAPDLLLLDEPTNHLDLEGIEWLEEQLKHWKGTVIVVAHDRAFLDAVVDRVWELEFGQVTAYRGNYSAYIEQRAARRAQQAAAYEAQQEHFAQTEDYIRRYMAGQRTSQAKGRLKRLEREKEAATLTRPQETTRIRLNLQTTLRSGDLVLGLYDLKAGYRAEQPLVSVEELELRRGQRVALVGPNGSGKTTLLRTILEQLPPLAGRIRVGSAVHPGYFAQVQEHLAPEYTVLDTLLDAGMASVGETRAFLARYGFRGDDVFKPIGVLSGGERARVALAILGLEKANFLLLDEPTNHLDLASQEVLQEVLLNFGGTLLLVSHDRYLIRALATHVWAIADETLYAFEGYAAYANWHQARRDGTPEAQQVQDKARQQREVERQAERARQKTLAQQQKRLETLETQIHALEHRMQELTVALDHAGRQQDISRVTRLGAEYREVEGQLNGLLEEWAEAAEAPGT